MFAFVDGMKLKLNVNGLRQIPRGFENYFNGIHFKNAENIVKAFDLAEKASKSFVNGIFYKDNTLIDLAERTRKELVKLIEDNDAETFYGYVGTAEDMLVHY